MPASTDGRLWVETSGFASTPSQGRCALHKVIAQKELHLAFTGRAKCSDSWVVEPEAVAGAMHNPMPKPSFSSDCGRKEVFVYKLGAFHSAAVKVLADFPKERLSQTAPPPQGILPQTTR